MTFIPQDTLPKGHRFINIQGHQYGQWKVIRFAGLSHHQSAWLCLCDCGTSKIVQASSLRRGLSKSCGCTAATRMRRTMITHGKTGTKAFKAWMSMKGRCYNANLKQFKYYGGRGITVCSRWLDRFENFLADMGEPPSASHSLDRIDVNGNYCPENCRWVTHAEQCLNKRTTRRATYRGVERPILEWCEILGLSYTRIMARFRLGWSTDEAFERDAWKRSKI